MNFTLRFPALIRFGSKTASECPDILPPGPVLFVSARHIPTELLVRMANNRPFEVIRSPGREPELKDIDHGCATAKQVNAVAVVGIGGGSVIDLAKSIAAVAPTGNMAADYFWGRRQIFAKGLFFVAIPSTAGTGAEVTSNAVITDSETKIKQSIKSPWMMADAALVDPDLLLNCPANVIAASGFDALTQAIEGYCSKGATHASQAWSLESANLVLSNLLNFYQNPADASARNAMAEGSLLAGLAFAQSGLGGVHGIGHPVGSLLKIPHGEVCAVLLVEILKRNQAQSSDLLQLSKLLGFESLEGFLLKIKNLRTNLNLKENFGGMLNAQDYDFIVRNCRSGSMKSNPKDYSDGEVISILDALA